jgi:hypothetical protein
MDMSYVITRTPQISRRQRLFSESLLAYGMEGLPRGVTLKIPRDRFLQEFQLGTSVTYTELTIEYSQ